MKSEDPSCSYKYDCILTGEKLEFISENIYNEFISGQQARLIQRIEKLKPFNDSKDIDITKIYYSD